MLTRLLAVGSLFLAAGACRQNPGVLTDDKIDIVATIGMLADAAKEIGGERVRVEALMGPGVDPHLYRATAGDVSKLDSADVILFCGLELEGRMGDVFAAMAKRTVTKAVGERVPKELLRQPKEFKGKFDPHIWFEVALWKHAVNDVCDVLAEKEPDSRAVFEANRDRYLRQLDELDKYVRTQIAAIPTDQRVLITAHDAFGYFGRAYGMEVRGIQGTSTATEAGAGDIQRLAGVIAERKIRAIFVESSISPATIEALQLAVKSRGWNVTIGGQLYSDALGSPGSGAETYVGMFRANVDTMVGALK